MWQKRDDSTNLTSWVQKCRDKLNINAQNDQKKPQKNLWKDICDMTENSEKSQKLTELRISNPSVENMQICK